MSNPQSSIMLKKRFERRRVEKESAVDSNRRKKPKQNLITIPKYTNGSFTRGSERLYVYRLICMCMSAVCMLVCVFDSYFQRAAHIQQFDALILFVYSSVYTFHISHSTFLLGIRERELIYRVNIYM